MEPRWRSRFAKWGSRFTRWRSHASITLREMAITRFARWESYAPRDSDHTLREMAITRNHTLREIAISRFARWRRLARSGSGLGASFWRRTFRHRSRRCLGKRFGRGGVAGASRGACLGVVLERLGKRFGRGDVAGASIWNSFGAGPEPKAYKT